MVELSTIQSTVQDVAEAISAAIGLETEIVSTAHIIVAGTGRYYRRIGTVEECGEPGTKEIYGTILRTGTEYVIEDALNDPDYWGYEGELAELCCPIITDKRVIGVIGLVAFNEEQRIYLITNQKKLLDFLRKMAFLIAGKVKEVGVSNRMRTLLHSIHEGIISIDLKGQITECNLMAASLMGKKESELLGEDIKSIWKGTQLVEVISSGVGYSDVEERCVRADGSEVHLFCNAAPIFLWTEDEAEEIGAAIQMGADGSEAETGALSKEIGTQTQTGSKKVLGKKQMQWTGDSKRSESLQGDAETGDVCIGAVVSFRDMAEVRKTVYNMTEKKEDTSIYEIVGISPQICRLRAQIKKIAESRSTVMITGESGTGKSLIAKAIHSASARKEHPFITVNCGAIPENLMESELFGYEAGSFTGASKSGKPGKFELAATGTIFLDEIGDLPLHLQVKLLHVLQTGKVERVGGSREIDVDVRVIVATNRNLEQMVIDREFREDLYFRFNVIPFWVPPLRERKEDIILLLKNALEKYNQLLDKNVIGYSEETLNLLREYRWPGNVRELENTVEYAVNMENDIVLSPDSLPARFRKVERRSTEMTLAGRCRELEREIIAEALTRTGYSVEAKKSVARELGMGEATLYRKMKELGIDTKKNYKR